jgi:2-isopropylmalate synthase
LRTIKIFDTTLRDGEQSPGITLQPDRKAAIALQLERLGVDVIEAGFAASSPGDFAGIEAVSEVVTRATVASLCRTSRADVDAAAAALRAAHRSRLHLVLATSALHMERKLRMEPSEVFDAATSMVAYAAGLADEVEFSCEDATRSDPAFVAAVCRGVIAAGATVVNLPDTVGYSLPNDYAAFLTTVLELCPELAGVELSVHCHNDLGLAVANTLAGVGAGASQVECTVNGIGERAGNAALEEVVIALRVRGADVGATTAVDLSEIFATSTLVSEETGYFVQHNKPVVGANAFAHEAGIHQDGMLKDSATYQIIDPAELGLVMTLPLGKHSGRHAFSRACTAAGIPLEGEELDAAFARFKALADSRTGVTLNDAFDEVPA